ncbi:MAG TPA: hypothetical protein VD768_08695 [Sphingomicrobium sp.]|nr:hypothetical protein [Sphingomicrobium sp.]
MKPRRHFGKKPATGADRRNRAIMHCYHLFAFERPIPEAEELVRMFGIKPDVAEEVRAGFVGEGR